MGYVLLSLVVGEDVDVDGFPFLLIYLEFDYFRRIEPLKQKCLQMVSFGALSILLTNPVKRG